jgi:hypothetical protein
MPVLGNTEEILGAEHDELHLSAQAASLAHRIAFGVHSGKPVRRLRLGNRLVGHQKATELSPAAAVAGL